MQSVGDFFAAARERFHRGAKKPPSASSLHQEKCSARANQRRESGQTCLVCELPCYKCSRGPSLLRQQNYINTNRCRNCSSTCLFNFPAASISSQIPCDFTSFCAAASRVLRSDSAALQLHHGCTG